MVQKPQFQYIVKHKIWIENEQGESLLGDGKWELLKAIHEHGCFKTAIEKMGWAYRTTWNKLKKIESKLGFPLTENHRGGTGGGGQTVLTQQGKELVEMFDTIHTLLDTEFEKIIYKHFYSK